MGMSGPACWEMEWAEVTVLDMNAASMGVDEWSLMSAAGKALADAAERISGDEPVLFVCGPGNNGGDGFAAAIETAKRGIEVSVIASHEVSNSFISTRARSEASESLEILIWPSKNESEFSLVVDCLLGAGGSGPGTSLRGPIMEMAEWVESLGRPVLACDIPTGIGSPDELTADHTVTFHSRKRGMSPISCGEISVIPLPWPREVENCGPGDVSRLPPFDPQARKGARGRLLVVGGGPYHGAPLLAGMAAARSGCDLVHVSMPSAASARAEWPVTLIPSSLPDSELLTMDSLDAISLVLNSPKPPQAMVTGPGLGRDERTMDAVRAILELVAGRGIPIVVDADAVAALPPGKWPSELIGVATPHIREAEGWLGGSDPSIALSSMSGEDAAIVITGPEDELTAPEGRKCKATGGHPRMSVGGTGDLLAGTIGGLLAQGMAPWPAARLGCALLREAGSRAAEITGPGLLAQDVPVHIAHTLSDWTGDS